MKSWKGSACIIQKIPTAFKRIFVIRFGLSHIHLKHLFYDGTLFHCVNLNLITFRHEVKSCWSRCKYDIYICVEIPFCKSGFVFCNCFRCVELRLMYCCMNWLTRHACSISSCIMLTHLVVVFYLYCTLHACVFESISNWDV